ncbi:hypothetical protein C2E23DRAFT_846290 [Lenzites betulinus]|nr:hypothetical protein C2E23DRAFT_846290 [Lenzites betulinus]
MTAPCPSPPRRVSTRLWWPRLRPRHCALALRAAVRAPPARSAQVIHSILTNHHPSSCHPLRVSTPLRLHPQSRLGHSPVPRLLITSENAHALCFPPPSRAPPAPPPAHITSKPAVRLPATPSLHHLSSAPRLLARRARTIQSLGRHARDLRKHLRCLARAGYNPAAGDAAAALRGGSKHPTAARARACFCFCFCLCFFSTALVVGCVAAPRRSGTACTIARGRTIAKPRRERGRDER